MRRECFGSGEEIPAVCKRKGENPLIQKILNVVKYGEVDSVVSINNNISERALEIAGKIKENLESEDELIREITEI